VGELPPARIRHRRTPLWATPDPYGEPSNRSDAHVRLEALPLAEGTTFEYVYDFGDHWEIEVQVETVLPLDRSPR